MTALTWRKTALLVLLSCSCTEDGLPPMSGELRPGLQSAASVSPAKVWEIPAGVKPRQWQWIVIHHSGTTEGSVAAFDRYHREVKGWEDLAYHFVIGNGRGMPDGHIEASARWLQQRAGAHAGSLEHNERGIGICLVGDFEKQRPTTAQMASVRLLVRALMERFGIPPERVIRHSDVVATKCPGKLMPWPLVD